MKLPAAVRGIIQRWVVRYPLWDMPPGVEAEDRARLWSTQLASQVAFEMPGQSWGKKRGDLGRPVSKDAIAQQQGSRLISWDLLTGTGTGSPKLVADPDGEDITGQVFVTVPPVDYLGGSITPPQPLPPPPSPQSIKPYWGDEPNRLIMVPLLEDYRQVFTSSEIAHDDGMAVWIGRTMYDCLVRGENFNSALARHRNEWRAILGLPQLP